MGKQTKTKCHWVNIKDHTNEEFLVKIWDPQLMFHVQKDCSYMFDSLRIDHYPINDIVYISGNTIENSEVFILTVTQEKQGNLC